MIDFNFKNHVFVKKTGCEKLNIALNSIDYICEKCGAQIRWGKFSYFWPDPKIQDRSDCKLNNSTIFTKLPSCEEIIIKSIIE